jgi:Spy/CpxP family protein refolding chaperone
VKHFTSAWRLDRSSHQQSLITLLFMKSMIKLPLVAVAFAMAIPFTQAQDTGTPPPPPPAGEHVGGREGPGKGPRGDSLKFLTEKLSLTPEQQAKIKPITDDQKKALDAVRADTSLERDARRIKAAEIIKAHMEQIKPLLTPEQLKKFEEMKDEFGHGPGGPRKEKAKE